MVTRLMDLFAQADTAAHAHAALNTALALIAVVLMIFIHRSTKVQSDD